MRPFSGQPRPEQDDFIHQRWTARFPELYRREERVPRILRSRGSRRREERSRLPGERGDGYSGKLTPRGYELELERALLFAWIRSPFYRYADFVLQADCSFHEENGYSALGFCLRQMNESNYYYFLVSSRGYFRFDRVFNGNPDVLIPWTRIREELWTPGRGTGGFHLRIIAHGDRFVFLLEEEWIGEVDDDAIPSGNWGWAGQNYDEKEEARFYLRRAVLESRPLEVEAEYYRWTRVLPADSRSRLELAENFHYMGAHPAALIQLKKILRERPLEGRERELLIRCLAGTGLYAEALEAARNLMAEKGADPDLLEISGACLYQLNRFLELRDLLKEHRTLLEETPWYWGLLGNGEYALGNYEAAAAAYDRAARMNPEEPLFAENLVRARARLGEAGAEAELEAALLYFRQGQLQEARTLLGRISPEDPSSPAARALEGKIWFQEEAWEKAETRFDELLEAGTADSSILLARKEEREAARELLEKAAEEEPGEFVYQFKAAESRFLSGLSPDPYLPRALELDPEDPWVHNLAGLDALERGEPRRAAEHLARALTLGADNPEILINLTRAQWESGDTAGALERLRDRTEPELCNHRGNLLAETGDYPGAVEAYEKALAADRENRTYLLNCAAACVEADYVHRAEELLQSLGEEEDPEVYNLLGNLARIKGEFSRAESAYRAALALDPENVSFLLNLAELQSLRGHYREARTLLEGIPPAGAAGWRKPYGTGWR